MIQLSVLDLAPITLGSDARAALARSAALAEHVEQLGYERFWLAEHHNMPGIASAATAVVIGHIAERTRRLKVGAGGIMLPNHAPLMVAEQFGTLEVLFPGRIELGVGRAPGTDPLTMAALRRGDGRRVDTFADDVLELLDYFAQKSKRPVRAIPGAGLEVPVWLLGSSTYGAALAARLGLPYAFAAHFAPGQLRQAVALYRREFRPSARLAHPRVMVGVIVVGIFLV